VGRPRRKRKSLNWNAFPAGEEAIKLETSGGRGQGKKVGLPAIGKFQIERERGKPLT